MNSDRLLGCLRGLAQTTNGITLDVAADVLNPEAALRVRETESMFHSMNGQAIRQRVRGSLLRESLSNRKLGADCFELTDERTDWRSGSPAKDVAKRSNEPLLLRPVGNGECHQLERCCEPCRQPLVEDAGHHDGLDAKRAAAPGAKNQPTLALEDA